MHANKRAEFLHRFDKALLPDDRHVALVWDNGYVQARHGFKWLFGRGG